MPIGLFSALRENHLCCLLYTDSPYTVMCSSQNAPVEGTYNISTWQCTTSHSITDVGANVKYRCEVLPCPLYSPHLAPLRLWPVWELGKLEEGLALWEWCGYPGSHAYIFVECWTGPVQQQCIKVHTPLQEMQDSNGIFEKKWQNINRTSSYCGQYVLSGTQICFHIL
jgi:hypothetical protein